MAGHGSRGEAVPGPGLIRALDARVHVGGGLDATAQAPERHPADGRGHHHPEPLHRDGVSAPRVAVQAAAQSAAAGDQSRGERRVAAAAHGPGCREGHALPAQLRSRDRAPRPEVAQPTGGQALGGEGVRLRAEPHEEPHVPLVQK